MKIVIFGASGSVGEYLLREALKRNHETVAVTRNTNHVTIQGAGLHVAEADLHDPSRLREALHGADAAIISLGDAVVATGTAAIVDAMRATGVSRIEVLTGFGTSAQSRRQLDPVMRSAVLGIRLLTHGSFAAKEKQDSIVRSSGLDYTIVQPPTLTHGPATDTYRHGNYAGKSIFGDLSRADLATFMLDNLDTPRYVNESAYVQS